MAVKCKNDQIVIFSWILWPMRKVREEGMVNVMSEPRLQSDNNTMPFDSIRLIYNGNIIDR